MGIVLEARGRVDRPRTQVEDTVVEFRVLPDDHQWRRLPLSPSLRLRNHSPTGFAWGYAGSGPAQLALALLLEATDRRFAVENYQAFKFDVLTRLAWDETRWFVRVDLERWLASYLTRDARGLYYRTSTRPEGVDVVQPYDVRGPWTTPFVDVEVAT
jgi:hypothetical protein